MKSGTGRLGASPRDEEDGTERPEGRVRLLNRDFVLLWQGQLVSQLGDQAFSIAVLYWLMEATGSAGLMGLLMMASLLPTVVLAPLGVALADGLPRLRIIVVSDLLRGGLILLAAWVMSTSAESIHLVVGTLLVVTFLGGVVRAVFQPAVVASIPDLVPRHRLAAGNSLHQVSTQASQLLGQAAGGLLFSALGAIPLLVLDGLSFLFSAGSASFIRMSPTKAEKATGAPGALSRAWEDARAGFDYVWRLRGLRSVLGIAAAINFLAMPVLVMLPFFASDTLGRDASWYGFLLAAMGCGALVGSLTAGAGGGKLASSPRILFGCLALISGGFVGLGFSDQPTTALAFMFLVGLGAGVVNLSILTLTQVAAPPAMRGRVLSLLIALSGVAAPLGLAVGGLLGELTDRDAPAIARFSGFAVLGLLIAVAIRPSTREFLRLAASREAEN